MDSPVRMEWNIGFTDAVDRQILGLAERLRMPPNLLIALLITGMLAESAEAARQAEAAVIHRHLARAGVTFDAQGGWRAVDTGVRPL